MDRAALMRVCERVLSGGKLRVDIEVCALALQRFLKHEARNEGVDRRAYQREYMREYRAGERRRKKKRVRKKK